MILHGIEYQRPTSLNMRIMADHVTYSFLAFMKSIFHFCLGCYCGGYSQNGRSNLSSWLCFRGKSLGKLQDHRVYPKRYIHGLLCYILLSLHTVSLWTHVSNPYPSGLLHWHWGNSTIAQAPVNWPWMILVKLHRINPKKSQTNHVRYS